MRLSQPSDVYSAMLFTLPGTVKLVISDHSNAYFPMAVTEYSFAPSVILSGITMSPVSGSTPVIVAVAPTMSYDQVRPSMVTSPANMADTASAARSAADVILFIWFSFLVVLLRCFALHAAMPEGVNPVSSGFGVLFVGDCGE